MVELTNQQHSVRSKKSTFIAAMQTPQSPKAYSYIRFSTPEQLKGDSLRRQLELSQKYAETHHLILDETLNLQDLGVSAFRSRNRTAGALAGFFRAIDDGMIPQGSFLLVESLDRLSRAEMTEALPAFLQIVNAGVTVVTLMDQTSYSKNSLNDNIGNLMMSLVIMARAHEESVTKSKRLSAAWKAKRSNIHEKKLTALTPGWLELEADHKTFRLIPDRAKLVRRMFAMSLDGHGKRSIVKQFNREGIDTWGRGQRKAKGWQESYVQKILNNRSVFGEYHPCAMINGKRVPVGDPIPDYYPRVIEEDQFQRIQRKPNGHSGPNANESNLFTGIAFDGANGAVMRFVNKGTSKRGKNKWRYLMSDNKRINPDAPSCYWLYGDFETLLMSNLVEVDWNKLNSQGDNSALEEINFQVADLTRRLAESEQMCQRLLHAIEISENPPASLVARLQSQEVKKSELTAQLSEKQNAQTDLAQRNESLLMNQDELRNAVDHLQDVTVRRKIKEELRRKIKRIDLYPKGLQKRIADGESELIIDTVGKVFAITFLNGVVRWVIQYPNPSDAISIHLVPTSSGPKLAFDHVKGHVEYRGQGIEYRMPSELKLLHSPVHADLLKSGKHKSVAGLNGLTG